MTVELQGLIDRINQEGVQKADAQKETIIADAKAQAALIVQKAQADAAEMVKNAQKEVTQLEQKAHAAINQSARDILLALRADLQRRLNDVVKSAVGGAMTPDVMGKIILELSKGNSQSTALVLPETMKKDLVEKLLVSLKENLKADPTLVFRNDFANGFKIGFKDSDLYLDFSEESLVPLVCSYVGPKIAAILEKK